MLRSGLCKWTNMCKCARKESKGTWNPKTRPGKLYSFVICRCVCQNKYTESCVVYQHCRWKAAGQWSQHSRSPPSRQLSQVSWLVARPALLLLLSNFRLRFSPSSDFGGASKVWICYIAHKEPENKRSFLLFFPLLDLRTMRIKKKQFPGLL